ncbi:MAG: pyridoxamine 5'-phosphate oxidase [Candidatus Tectomicrobia bacterium]|nr:pyridoxamine 5'-phosphate oxidase [Candidatus Tectomicrobia bacterium]
MAIQELIDRLRSEELGVDTVDADPLRQFKKWYGEALRAEVIQPDAMHLSTVSAEGVPSGRLVLYKDPETHGLAVEGFLFFTNLNSPKARDILRDPRVAATFYWTLLGRQVRIEGGAKRAADEAADRYFDMRPDASKLSAWASPQSRVIEDRASLLEAVERHRKRFEGKRVPRPDFWGGFVITPSRMEFWKHREDRLHDRVLYERREDGGWSRRRLAP